MASTLHAVNRRTNWYFGMIILKHAGSLSYTISTVRTTTYCHWEKKLRKTRFCKGRGSQDRERWVGYMSTNGRWEGELGVAASVLAVVCKQMQQLQAMLGPAVDRGKGMTFKTLETMCNASAWLSQCWKSCANGFKIVALRFDDHETKEMLGVVGSKVWPVSNFAQAQQHATRRRNGRNMYHLTMLGVVGQESCVLLHGALLGKKEGKYR